MNELRVGGERFLCILIEEESQLKGGLILPPNSNTAQIKCKVVTVGPDVKTVSEGDIVILSIYGGSKVSINGIIYLYVLEDEILAILPRE